MVRKLFFYICAIFVLSGCHHYNAMEMFKKDDSYEKAVLHTKSGQIVSSLETKAKITVTYLNPLYPNEYSDKDYFFVGVYIPNDYDVAEKRGLMNPDFKLSLQKEGDTAPVKISEIVKKENDPLYKKMPLTDEWSRYYLVSFEKIKADKTISLALKNISGGETVLNFQR